MALPSGIETTIFRTPIPGAHHKSRTRDLVLKRETTYKHSQIVNVIWKKEIIVDVQLSGDAQREIDALQNIVNTLTETRLENHQYNDEENWRKSQLYSRIYLVGWTSDVPQDEIDKVLECENNK